MRKYLLILLALSLSTGGFAQDAAPAAATSDTPAWMQVLAKRHADLIERNGPGTDTTLQAKLLAMREEDQAAPERGLTNVAPEDAEKMRVAANLHETDTRLTAELKAIVARQGWPTIALVGYDASNASMLVLTHSRDHAWQGSLLPKLEAMAKADKIDGSMLALVVDKQLVAEGKLQRYGTQFKFQDGEMMMFAVEDPANLDQRREAVMLPPLAEYKKRLAEMYHQKASDMIVRATPPAGTDAAPATKAVAKKK